MPSPWNRCFIALSPDAPTREMLANLPVARPARRVAFDDLHLTLAFLGAVTPAQGHALGDAIHELATPLPALEFLNLALWPGPGRPQVQVAQFGYPDALRALVRDVQAVQRRLDLPVESRKFRPHVTLARFRGGAGAVDAESLMLMESLHGVPAAHFDAIALYASMPAGSGPRYRMLEQAPLQPWHPGD